VGIWAWLAVYLAIHFHLGTILIARTNRDRLATDQQNNIELALASRADVVPFRTDGVVNPLWPWVASRFATEDQERFFMRGRWFNLVLAAAVMAGVGLAAARVLPLGAAVAVLFAGGIAGLLPQAVWFQPETLYFSFFAITAALCWATLWRNPLWLHAAIGLSAGLAYLAKASVTLLLAAWVGASAVRAVAGWISRGRDDGWRPWRSAVGLGIVAAVFVAVIAPRAWFARERFGDPLHSYPKYWMWHDDFGKESVPFMAAHRDAASLRALDPERRPSAGNYLRAHGWEGVRERLVSGVVAKAWRFLLPEGKVPEKRPSKGWKSVAPARGWWLAPCAVVCAAGLIAGLAFAGVRARWSPAGVAATAFVAAAFLVYLLAYGWYHAIGRGDRFMVSLYLPLVAALAGGAVGLAGRGRWRLAATAACWITVALVLLRVAEMLRDPVFAG